MISTHGAGISPGRVVGSLEPLLANATKAGQPPVWPRGHLIDGMRFRSGPMFRDGTHPSSTGRGAGSTNLFRR